MRTRAACVTAVAGLVAASSAFASHGASQTLAADGRQQALLQLYALDSRLETARAHVSSLLAEAARIRRERRTLRAELRDANATLAVSQHQLALQLRTLYEQGSVDSIAVVLGASSLGEGVQRLDRLQQFAAASKQIAARTRTAERRLLRARRTLAAERRRLGRSIASARAAEQTIAGAEASKSAYVASLGPGNSGLISTAQAAATKSQQIGSGTNPPPGGTKMTVDATCYILKGTTASGLPVGPGVVAVDPTVIPLGTKLYIPGYGNGIAADTGGGIKGTIIDLWYSSYAQCAKWGRRTVTITVY